VIEIDFVVSESIEFVPHEIDPIWTTNGPDNDSGAADQIGGYC
jgi:hypothetical protein